MMERGLSNTPNEGAKVNAAKIRIAAIYDVQADVSVGGVHGHSARIEIAGLGTVHVSRVEGDTRWIVDGLDN